MLHRVQVFAIPWTEASQTPLSMEFFRQASILEWVAISYVRGSSRLKDWAGISCVSCIGRQIFATVPSRQNYTEKIPARADLCLIFSEGDRWGPKLCSCQLETCKSIPPPYLAFVHILIFYPSYFQCIGWSSLGYWRTNSVSIFF